VTVAWKTTAGLVAAPMAWAVSTQLGQVLPYVDCDKGIPWSLGAAAAGAIVAIVGAGLSLGAEQLDGRTRAFIGYASAGIALIFAFALVLQGTAGVLVNPCQR
jgi:hypothetical protein